jgi:hypothetical protein
MSVVFVVWFVSGQRRENEVLTRFATRHSW